MKEADLTSLLFRCGAFDSYRQMYPLDTTLRNTIDFLLYSPHFSGSLKFCSDEIKEALVRIDGKQEGNTSVCQSLERIRTKLEGGHSGKPLAGFLKSLYQESIQIGEIIDEIYFNIFSVKQPASSKKMSR